MKFLANRDMYELRLWFTTIRAMNRERQRAIYLGNELINSVGRKGFAAELTMVQKWTSESWVTRFGARLGIWS